MILSIFLSFFFFQTSVTPATPTPLPSVMVKVGEMAKPTPIPVEEPVTIARHSIRANGKTLNYTTTTGFMPIRNDRTNEIEAKIFFMAYTLDSGSNVSKRNLMFSFNGGPGSASVWLHLGALGPKRVKMLDNGLMPPPPYELVDNDQTWLDQTDMVFIDPVGTGYSRAAKPELAAKFFGVNGDADSIAEFIRLYLGQYQRWSSPMYLVGESYGTTRASALSNVLFEKGIGLNGIILVSTVMNFQTIRFAEGNDVTYPLIMPSYAATAWYHKRLAANYQSKPLRQFLDEVENWVTNDYSVALLKGDRLTPAERQTLSEKFSSYTGLSKQFIEESNYRVDLNAFNKELLRDQRRTTGRLDSRFTGIDRNAAADSPETDPSMNAIRPPFTSTFNDYVRRDLGFRSDLEYYILGGGITSPWNWNVNNGYANTAAALQSAMQKNPYMKVFVGCGYYDMATPYFAAEYTIAAMNLDPTLRKNISLSYYEAGHMMYIEKNSLKKLKDDVSKFIQNSTNN